MSHSVHLPNMASFKKELSLIPFCPDGVIKPQIVCAAFPLSPKW